MNADEAYRQYRNEYARNYYHKHKERIKKQRKQRNELRATQIPATRHYQNT